MLELYAAKAAVLELRSLRNVPLRIDLSDADIARFWESVPDAQWDRRDDACWPWIGPIKESGYGRFWAQGRYWAAHRVSYTIVVREIPDGFEVDHTCRYKDCVNPWHLEAVSPQVNRQRRILHYRSRG